MRTKNNAIQPAVCPRCGRTYRARPAVSRVDSTMLICPECGTREALEDMGVSKAEQDQIIATINRHRA